MKYAKRADIFDRIEINGTINCFITLTDHKENFTTRLTNPAKSESELANRYWIKSTFLIRETET